MKTKKQISSSVEAEAAETRSRVPFFAQKLDPEALRSIRGGDDMAQEARVKLGG